MGKDDFPVSGCAIWVSGEVSSRNKEDAEGDTKFEGNWMGSYLDVLNWSTYRLFGAGEFRRKCPAGSWKNGVSGKLSNFIAVRG